MSAVPAILALPRVLAAIRGVLLADPQLTGRLARMPTSLGAGPAIYTDGAVPANARTDYLLIGPCTERSTATMGSGRKWGSELTVPVKLVSATQDKGAAYLTLDRLVALLGSVPLTVQDYATGSCVLDVIVDSYEEVLAGVQFSHYPTIWRVRVHQAT